MNACSLQQFTFCLHEGFGDLVPNTNSAAVLILELIWVSLGLVLLTLALDMLTGRGIGMLGSVADIIGKIHETIMPEALKRGIVFNSAVPMRADEQEAAMGCTSTKIAIIMKKSVMKSVIV